MSAPSKPLVVGETVACYTILKVICDASSGTHRRYWAKAECCGLIVDRSEHSLKEARKNGVTQCHRCAQQAANLQLKATYGYLERFGSVRVLDRGPEIRTWKVIWDCCGKEAVLTQVYLNMQKQARAAGKPPTICLECSIKRAKLLAKEREKPSKQSLRKADLLPIREDRPVPLPPGIIRAREAPQKPLVLQPMGATLPPGVVPAAIAWPRPSVTPSTIAGRTILSRHADARAVTLALTVTHSPDI